MRKERGPIAGCRPRPSRYFCWSCSLPTELVGERPLRQMALTFFIIFPRQGLMSSALLARLHQAPPRLPELPDRSRSDKNLRLRDSPSPSKHGLSAKKFYPEQEFTFEELVSYLSIRVATRASSSSYYISRPGTSYHWTLVKRNQATY